MTEPIEREDTDHGVALHPDEAHEAHEAHEAPMTERPPENPPPHAEAEAAEEPAHEPDPEAEPDAEAVNIETTTPGMARIHLHDAEVTVNLTGGDLDATVNLSGNDELSVAVPAAPVPERDDAAVASEVTRGHLKGLLEALIFASDRPIKAGELAKSATAATKMVKELLEELKGEYTTRGMQLDEVAGGWIFRTNAAYAPFVRDLSKQKPVKLTRAQIETLSILAYRQPITRPEIDDIRGVDCGPVLKLLLERDLIRILGKKDEPGRPILYGTTTQFLEFFGLKSLRDLPTLREFTDLNEDSRRTVEKELGETLELTAEAQGGLESEGGVVSGDTLPPDLAEEPGTSTMKTEIPPPMTGSDTLDGQDAASLAAQAEAEEAQEGENESDAESDEREIAAGDTTGKGEKPRLEGELDPEEEFPDDDDSDFDDEDGDDDDEEDEEDGDEGEADE